MTSDQVIEWVLWLGLVWSVFLAYCAVDAPTLTLHWHWKRGRR